MSKLQKSRLGRGLSSLISSPQIPVEVEVQPVAPLTLDPPAHAGQQGQMTNEVALELISPNPHQPRKSLDEAKVAELAASIKSSGIIQPIIVRRVIKVAGNGHVDRYELIAGERRWRAAKLAGLATIPVIIRDVGAFEQAQMALIENIQREDLNPIDRASSYRALINQLGLTQAELANRIGEDRSSIANFLRLLDLSDTVREMIRAGALSVGHAKLIAGIDDPIEQDRLANLVKSQELSVRNLERAIAQAKDGTTSGTPVDVAAGAPPDNRPTLSIQSAHIVDLEKSIARQLGMRVQLRPSARKGRGRLVFHYATLDQFDTLLQKLGVETD